MKFRRAVGSTGLEGTLTRRAGAFPFSLLTSQAQEDGLAFGGSIRLQSVGKACTQNQGWGHTLCL